MLLGTRQSGPVLQVKNLSKAFGGVQALRAVQFSIQPGTVHALMGENGAGKSTLMKVLAGIHQPDSGEIIYQGHPVKLRNPHEALKRGILMIHQELMPFPHLTVAENICMGREPAGRIPGTIDRSQMDQDAKALLARVGADFSPEQRMGDLSVAGMQLVEIARALAHQARVLIMDEPTSALSDREVEALFRIIRELKREGVAIVYISHKFDEVFALADEVTVLRDGAYVDTLPAGGLSREHLIHLMVGRELNVLFPKNASQAGEVLLEVRGLTRSGKFQDVNFRLRRGEILGFAGLMGAGRTEMGNAIYGLEPPETGTILLWGKPVNITSPADAIGHGIGMVSEDRKEFGLVLQLSVQQNLTLAGLARCSRGPLISASKEQRLADEQIQAFNIRTPSREQIVERLSGGNQQKVVIARALLTEPDVLILDEPTRGIDIGAKAEVYALVQKLAAQGKAILLISSELPEILALSHRILVMRAGRLVAELDPRTATQEAILHAAMHENTRSPISINNPTPD
jgi:inositol transport system ATP-binding protein